MFLDSELEITSLMFHDKFIGKKSLVVKGLLCVGNSSFRKNVVSNSGKRSYAFYTKLHFMFIK